MNKIDLLDWLGFEQVKSGKWKHKTINDERFDFFSTGKEGIIHLVFMQGYWKGRQNKAKEINKVLKLEE